MSPPDVLDELIGTLATAMSDVRALLDDLAHEAATHDAVEVLVRRELSRPGSIVLGAGVIRAGGRADSLWWWWRRGTVTSELLVALEPTSLTFYDVEHQPWFLEPLQSGTLNLVGPYLDRSGTNLMVVTVSRPAPGAPAGIVGADLSLDAIFRLLVATPAGRQLPWVLENLEGRVIASADPAITVGERDVGPWRIQRACPMLPWRVVVRASAAASDSFASG
ncbi:conserved hypothetical protein [Acidimicrobium ferrooxidans DSM 10331]|uniref:Cache domain-containing protein n=1 Tax=Acidimicrobium ferrooxidans (strain DSM 10331 / JCM 15462 / NBRC 103882 / ICP) TaxID=525909 RepID=C7M2B8_ACIFD|nr:cache domain-containing protein [Acidimicrobium ferrooxidans]ACU54907.1 conserved hypothetical protein [Acidimicrobium ferrooxidans DSM 10331]